MQAGRLRSQECTGDACAEMTGREHQPTEPPWPPPAAVKVVGKHRVLGENRALEARASRRAPQPGPKT